MKYTITFYVRSDVEVHAPDKSYPSTSFAEHNEQDVEARLVPGFLESLIRKGITKFEVTLSGA